MKDEERIIQLLRSITSSLSCTLNHNYEPFGLTGVQCLVLMEVACSEDEVSIGDLAKKLLMSNSNISAIVKRMTQRELLLRKRSEQDERIVCISLAPKAKQMIAEMETCMSQKCCFLQSLDAQQIEVIIESLRVLDVCMKGGISDEKCK